MSKRTDTRSPEERMRECAERVVRSMHTRAYVEDAKARHISKKNLLIPDPPLPSIRKHPVVRFVDNTIETMRQEQSYGYVYVAAQSDYEEHRRKDGKFPAKIGLSKTPHIRMQGLQTASWKSFDLLLCSFCALPAGRQVEARLHRYWKDSRIKREWFYLDDCDIEVIDIQLEIEMFRMRIMEDVVNAHDATDGTDDERMQCYTMLHTVYKRTLEPDFQLSEQDILLSYARPMERHYGPEKMAAMRDEMNGMDTWDIDEEEEE